MQALCANCNLKKGAKMKNKPRQHQIDLEDRANRLVRRDDLGKKTVMIVTPGGGKSYAAARMGQIGLLGKLWDAVCWVAPRSSLAKQAESTFHEDVGVPARCAQNTPPLLRDGARCYTTTYQAIAANPDLHRDEFARRRYFLILDEPHHLAEKEGEAAGWARAVAPLVEKAAHVLFMTGTPDRSDRQRVPFLDDYYTEHPDGTATLRHDVRYDLRMALEEQPDPAVLKAEFHYCDARVSWERLNGGGRATTDLSASVEDPSSALRTFLAKSGPDLVAKGLRDWLVYRASYPRSHCIVVADSQAAAKRYAGIARTETGESVALAISDDSTEAHRALRRFRTGKGARILVTVGMAYEGLDAPHASHLILLTANRWHGWLMQSVARVTRFQKGKRAFVYVPDDPRMREFVEWMKHEQQVGAKEREKREGVGGDRTPNMIPVDSEVTDWRIQFGDLVLDGNEAAQLHLIRTSYPELHNLSPDRFLALRDDLNKNAGGSRDAELPEPPSVTEEKLRKACQSAANSIDHARGWEPGKANDVCKRHFRKPRTQMGIAELREVLAFLESLRGAA